MTRVPELERESARLNNEACLHDKDHDMQADSTILIGFLYRSIETAVGSTSMRAYRHLPKRLGMDRIGA